MPASLRNEPDLSAKNVKTSPAEPETQHKRIGLKPQHKILLQEQMVEADEHCSRILHEQHVQREVYEKHSAEAIRALKAQLAEATLREYDLQSRLNLAQQVGVSPSTTSGTC